jgi:O-antigen biosynthesis protein WbqP
MTIKRVFDFSAAVFGLIAASPIIAVCILLIRLDSKGPALFRQVRVGMNGRHFTCYKLRTMHLNSGDVPTHQMSSSALTRVGKHLRRLKLDELPQFWNILRGDMSMVGPRPCLPTQTELVNARRRYGLMDIPPGITGVSQVAGIDMSDPEILAVSDAQYLDDMSLRRDLSLILQTITGSGRGDRVRTN